VTAGRTEEASIGARPHEPLERLNGDRCRRRPPASERKSSFVAGALSALPPRGARVIGRRLPARWRRRFSAKALSDVVVMAAVGDGAEAESDEAEAEQLLTRSSEPTEDIPGRLRRGRRSIRVLVRFALETGTPEEAASAVIEAEEEGARPHRREPPETSGAESAAGDRGGSLGKDGFREEIPLLEGRDRRAHHGPNRRDDLTSRGARPGPRRRQVWTAR
jgi:hypothetical protein